MSVTLPSIRGRLARSLFATAAAWAVAVSAVLWVIVRHEVDELMDTTLQESAEILAGLLRSREDFGANLTAAVLPQMPHEERLAWQLVNSSGTVLIKSYVAPSEPFGPEGSQGFSELTPGWRVFSMKLARDGPVLHVAQSQAERFEARTEAVVLTIIAALLVGALSALWMRRRVGLELESLSTMADRVAAIDIDASAPDLPMATREELATVRNAIIGLAERLRQRVESERAFSAHAAHALRTPLAAIVAQLAVAERQAPPPARLHVAQARTAAHRLGHVVSALMALFRANEDIRPQAMDLQALLTPLPVDKRLAVHVAHQDRLVADPDLLAAVLINLLDNSAKHGATVVTVTHSRAGGKDLLVVEDNGAGAAAAGCLTEPQDWHDHAATAGGLGLALARLVAQAHGGDVDVVTSASGFRVELRWPHLAVMTTPTSR